MNEDREECIYGGIFGVATGDALGVPVEFKPRSSLDADPVKDFRAYGTHSYPAGTWSDDTSLTLALLDSLSTGLDYADIAGNFLSWAREGAYTAGGEVFDIGGTTSEAVERIAQGMDPLHCGETHEHSNGNGSLMRILPAAFFVMGLPITRRKQIIFDISAITHGHPRSKIACFFYSEIVRNIVNGFEKEAAVESAYHSVISSIEDEEPDEFSHFIRCRHHIKELPREKISSKGYVVSTLEASLWSFLTTESFEEAVLQAVNLGEDTDTTGAVTGGLAGCYYGFGGIPDNWIGMLKRNEYIDELCESFVKSIDEYVQSRIQMRVHPKCSVCEAPIEPDKNDALHTGVDELGNILCGECTKKKRAALMSRSFDHHMRDEQHVDYSSEFLLNAIFHKRKTLADNPVIEFSFNDYGNFDAELNSACEAFYALIGLYPNIMVSSHHVYSEIDKLLNKRREEQRKKSDRANLAEASPFAPGEDDEISLSSFQTNNCEIEFAIDDDLEKKRFMLVYDDEPEFVEKEEE
ncbi:MAG: ADP-ribosylglycohydrolase family protein [Spirochaetaceae bacterium]